VLEVPTAPKLFTTYAQEVDQEYGLLWRLDAEGVCNWCMGVILDTPGDTLVAHTLIDVMELGVEGLVVPEDWEVPLAHGHGAYGSVDWFVDLLQTFGAAQMNFAVSFINSARLQALVPATVVAINRSLAARALHLVMTAYMHFKHEIYAAMEELSISRFLARHPPHLRGRYLQLFRTRLFSHRVDTAATGFGAQRSRAA
jgi:hypothetical protein